MKNKFSRLFGALLAVVLCFCCFPASAFAMAAPEPEPTEEPTTGGIEEPVEEEPLTPEGNATLVDDYGGNKQLITITTKNGNYFYILVDRDDEGENTVHFLNQVDEADLMALIEDGDTEVAPAVCTCTEKCEAGAVNTACPVCSTNMTACAGKEAEPEPDDTEQPEEGKKNNMGGVLILVVVLAAGGGVFYYLKFMKPKKQSVKGDTELDDLEFDDDEDEEDYSDPDEEAPKDAESERDDE